LLPSIEFFYIQRSFQIMEYCTVHPLNIFFFPLSFLNIGRDAWREVSPSLVWEKKNADRLYIVSVPATGPVGKCEMSSIIYITTIEGINM
jgi:hypothetical protein